MSQIGFEPPTPIPKHITLPPDQSGKVKDEDLTENGSKISIHGVRSHSEISLDTCLDFSLSG